MKDSAESLLGATLRGVYRLDELVSAGERTAVFRATKLSVDQTVAVKCLVVPPGASEELVAEADDFGRRNRLLALICRRASATVKVLDMGMHEAPGTGRVPFVVEEWLEGEVLTSILERSGAAKLSSWSFESVVNRMREPMVGLAKAHSVGVCHGDMGPHSLFVCGEIEDPKAPIKLLNLGFCLETRTQNSEPLAFHPQYGTPEHFARRWDKIGNPTDVFSVALLLVELMLGGKPALLGNSVEDLARAASDPGFRPSPRNRGLRVTNSVESAFAKALAVDPAERFGHIGEFIADLDYALANQPKPQTQLESAEAASVAGAIDVSGD